MSVSRVAPLLTSIGLLLVAFLFLVGEGHIASAALPAKIPEGMGAPPPRRGGAWQPLQTTNPPPARRDAALAYDGERHRLILFGGRNDTGSLDDTWALELATMVWEPLATGSAMRPPARHSMVAGVDSINQRFLITTGQAPGELFNDTWQLDLTTNTWSELPAQGEIPDIRYGAAGGIADGDDTLWLSHGFTEQGRFDDTRRLTATGAWQDVTPAANRPLPRCLHAATITPNSDMVLFGGCASGFGPCPLNDTWLFEQSTGNWREIPTPADVEPRLFPALVTLGDSGRVLLFGGEAGTNDFGDSWLLDVDSEQWMELPAIGNTPQARAGHSMVWVPALTNAPDGAALLFGGQNGEMELNDLWMFIPATEPSPSAFTLFLPGTRHDAGLSRFRP
jgi:hypothetical protein